MILRQLYMSPVFLSSAFIFSIGLLGMFLGILMGRWMAGKKFASFCAGKLKDAYIASRKQHEIDTNEIAVLNRKLLADRMKLDVVHLYLRKSLTEMEVKYDV